MKTILRQLVFSVVLLLGISGYTNPASSADQTIRKVRVYRNGMISLDGRKLSIDEMRKELADLKRINGVVWYFRESGPQEPHQNANLVVQAIIDNKLPVSLSNKEDFSTVVLQDGTIKPR